MAVASRGFGDRVVWIDSRDGGLLSTGVYLYDFLTHEEIPIVTQSSYAPDISGDRVIWQQGSPGSGWDIYSYDLSTDEIMPISSAPDNQMEPAIDGNVAVWTDSRDGQKDIYLYDFEMGEER